jgi:hypothetical protein
VTRTSLFFPEPATDFFWTIFWAILVVGAGLVVILGVVWVETNGGWRRFRH